MGHCGTHTIITLSWGFGLRVKLPAVREVSMDPIDSLRDLQKCRFTTPVMVTHGSAMEVLMFITFFSRKRNDLHLIESFISGLVMCWVLSKEWVN